MTIPEEISSILICPDDFSKLSFNEASCICTKCNKNFSIKDNLVELKPEKYDLNIEAENRYKEYYENLLRNGKDEKHGIFGLISSSVLAGFVKETFSHIEQNIHNKMIVCDIGAGSGDYSIKIAHNCKFILHCDLDLDGIKIAQHKAKLDEIKNIIFVCCDYLKLPIRLEVIDLVYSIDILERGKIHEENLLREIYRIVKKNGTMILDFHAKERKKLTHVENTEIFAYSKEEIFYLMKKFELRINRITGTGFMPQIKKWSNKQYKFLNSVARLLSLPPARWIVFLTKDNQ